MSNYTAFVNLGTGTRTDRIPFLFLLYKIKVFLIIERGRGGVGRWCGLGGCSVIPDRKARRMAAFNNRPGVCEACLTP